jgi:hypothetical protein
MLRYMGKIWHLDTETKGTGAHVAPFDPRAPRPAEEELSVHFFTPPPPPRTAPEGPAPLRFKVVDVLGARVLGEDVDAQRAVELLEGLRSVLDARVYVWSVAARRWRLLTLGEQRALWGFRGRGRGEKSE